MMTIDLLSTKDLEIIHEKIDRMIELLEQKKANDPGGKLLTSPTIVFSKNICMWILGCIWGYCG
jgi:hypothetical protein